MEIIVNYQKHYDLLISSRSKLQTERSIIWEKRKKLKGNDKLNLKLFQNHHIIPKCLEGTNDKSNLILLTPREHYISHWLLAKIYPSTGLIMAQLFLSHDKNNLFISSKKYELLCERISIYQSISISGRKASPKAKLNMSNAQSGKNHPMYGKHHSKESKLKMSAARSGSKHHLYGKHHTSETKQKMSDSHMGKKLSDETKAKMSKSRKGKKGANLSTETRRKMSISKTGENNPFSGKHHSKESKLKMSLFGETNGSYGKKYWESNGTRNNINILNRWTFLNVLYPIWIDNNKCGAKMLKNKSIHITIIDMKCTYNSIIDYFKNVGNPMLDNKWLNFKEKYG